MNEPPSSARETLLVTAARTALAAFRDTIEARRLTGPAIAALRLLETALEPYGAESPPPPETPSTPGPAPPAT